MRTVTYCTENEETPTIASAALGWRDGELRFDEASRVAASAALEYYFRRPSHGYSDYDLQHELEAMLGAGSAEMAMLDAGLARLLAGPFLAGIDVQEREAQNARLGGMRSHFISSRYWYLAWWCVVEVPAPEDLRQAEWLLTQAALDKLTSHAVNVQGAFLRVGAEPFPLQLEPSALNRAWNTETAAACGGARALIDWISSRTPSFRSRFRYEMREGGVRWGFPVLARADTEVKVLEARAAWEDSAAQAIEARLYTPEVGRSKRALPPPGVRVLSKTAAFMEPECEVNELLALYSGRRWDAQARLAL